MTKTYLDKIYSADSTDLRPFYAQWAQSYDQEVGENGYITPLRIAEALARHVNEAAARKARAPFSFRDGEAIATLLNEGGFDVLKLAGVVLERRLDDLRAQIMALPIEADLRAAGDAVTDVMINDVAAALAPYKTAGLLSVPQEAHLFYARPIMMVR